MTIRHAHSSSTDRVDGVLLRSLGRLSLATWDLAAVRCGSLGSTGGASAWKEFADHLADAADAVREGACGSSYAGNTIAVLRHGVRVPVDVDYIDRLSEKIDRHVRVGRALGVADIGADDPALDASA